MAHITQGLSHDWSEMSLYWEFYSPSHQTVWLALSYVSGLNTDVCTVRDSWHGASIRSEKVIYISTWCPIPPSRFHRAHILPDFLSKPICRSFSSRNREEEGKEAGKERQAGLIKLIKERFVRCCKRPRFTAGGTRDLPPYMGRDPLLPPRRSGPYVGSRLAIMMSTSSWFW